MSSWQEANATNDATWDTEQPIEGKYISNKSGVGPNKSMVYTLDTGLARMGVWGSTVLDSKFQEIPIGSTVRIEFLGMKDGKGGKTYKDFKVLYKDAPMAKADVVIGPDDELDTDVSKIPF